MELGSGWLLLFIKARLEAGFEQKLVTTFSKFLLELGDLNEWRQEELLRTVCSLLQTVMNVRLGAGRDVLYGCEASTVYSNAQENTINFPKIRKYEFKLSCSVTVWLIEMNIRITLRWNRLYSRDASGWMEWNRLWCFSWITLVNEKHDDDELKNHQRPLSFLLLSIDMRILLLR